MPRAGAACPRTLGERSIEKEQTVPYGEDGMDLACGVSKERRRTRGEQRLNPLRDITAGQVHVDLYPPVSENGFAAEKRERGTSVRHVAVK